MVTDTVDNSEVETDGLSVAQINQAIIDSVGVAIAPVVEQQNKLAQRLDELSKPQSQSGRSASSLYGGGSAGIRQGEDTMSSRGYSFARMMYALGTGDWGNAKVEQDISNRLHEVYSNPAGGQVLAPIGRCHLRTDDSRLAAECQQTVIQGVANADFDDMQRFVRQSNGGSIWDDSAGGALMGAVQQGEIIDLLRDQEWISRAGAREFSFPGNGQIQFPKKKKSGNTGYWVGEGQTIGEGKIATGNLNMRARKLGAIITVPNELLRFASENIEAYIRMELVEAMATTLNQALLIGNGSELTPKGLLTYSGINRRTATTVGANGDTLEPEDIAFMIAELEELNVDTTNFKFLSRPMLFAALMNRRADAVAEGDRKGQFIFNTTADPVRGNSLNGHEAIKTGYMPKNGKKGTATNLTTLLGGVFSEYLIGRAGALEFAVSTDTGSNFTNDQTSLRVIQHIDGKPRREEAFVAIDKLQSA